ncbi:hypothetical protein ACLI09_15940 [Flavobacterium sp. RHBU_24]|uniref:hypothetical protein n=1 Tax=Flavobacterium sp. RHBU_24 TaxID=3391185 RepID=UPI003984CE86
MQKLLIFLLSFLLCASCKENTKAPESEKQEEVDDYDKFEKLDKTSPFFDFDGVSYYHNDLTDGEFADLIEKEDSITKSEDDLVRAITSDIPEKLNDTLITNIKDNYPLKIEIPEKDIPFLKDIFMEKYTDRNWSTICEARYHDVLVFSKNGKITGIVKICFDCWQFSFSGTKAHTGGFGLNNDLYNLHKLLYEKLPADDKSKIAYEKP